MIPAPAMDTVSSPACPAPAAPVAPMECLAARGAGFGLGLRTEHYPDFLAAPQPLDWLEIITDNFLVEGGKPLVMLDALRRDYPMAMHGVALSLGAPDGLDRAYLGRVKALAQRVQPLWVSDHLCWTGPGPEQLHDLYPLPYTDEAARRVVDHIRQAQDVLGRRLVLENVSSYLTYTHSAMAEWQFLSHIANESDCLLLVDVNNIHVSSVNHGFDPLDYLHALPAHRVQQIHLAGHSLRNGHAIDTHDHPVAPVVWDLYAHACRLWGAVPAMIERDAHIPPLATLLDELRIARRVAGEHPRTDASVSEAVALTAGASGRPTAGQSTGPGLSRLQRDLADFILSEPPATEADATTQGHDPWPQRHTLEPWVDSGPDWTRSDRLQVYHHAYRARLAEVLADSLAKTHLYMGSDAFDEQAHAFSVAHPPRTRSLHRYGAGFAAWLAQAFPANPELHELAQLDWDLRACFDGPDVPALTLAAAQGDATLAWMQRSHPLHPSLVLRPLATNAVLLWSAIAADADVPPPHRLPAPTWRVVWRHGLQPHFQSVDADQAQVLSDLQRGDSLQAALDAWAQASPGSDPQSPARWLRAWLDRGWLRS